MDLPSFARPKIQPHLHFDVTIEIPKGTKNKEAAMAYIAHATSAEAQAAFAVETGYAPINTGSAALMDEAVRATLPDQQTAVQVNADMAYWAEHRDEIGNRWYAWQAQ